MKSFWQHLIESEQAEASKIAKEHESHIRTGLTVLHALTEHPSPLEDFIQEHRENFNNRAPHVTHENEHYHVTLTHPSQPGAMDLTVRYKTGPNKGKAITIDLATAKGYKSIGTSSAEKYMDPKNPVFSGFSKQWPLTPGTRTPKKGSRAGQEIETLLFPSGKRSISAKSLQLNPEQQKQWRSSLKSSIENTKGESLLLTDQGHVLSKREGMFSHGGEALPHIADHITGIRYEDRSERSGVHFFIARGKLSKSGIAPKFDLKNPDSIRGFFRELRHH